MIDFTQSERELAQWLHDEWRKNILLSMNIKDAWLCLAREIRKKVIDKNELYKEIDKEIHRWKQSGHPNKAQAFIDFKSHFLKDSVTSDMSGISECKEASVATEDESGDMCKTDNVESSISASVPPKGVCPSNCEHNFRLIKYNTMVQCIKCGYNPDNSVSVASSKKREKCIYCGKEIHIKDFAGFSKKGIICSNSLCLMKLAKELDKSKDINSSHHEATRTSDSNYESSGFTCGGDTKNPNPPSSNDEGNGGTSSQDSASVHPIHGVNQSVTPTAYTQSNGVNPGTEDDKSVHSIPKEILGALKKKTYSRDEVIKIIESVLIGAKKAVEEELEEGFLEVPETLIGELDIVLCKACGLPKNDQTHEFINIKHCRCEGTK